MEEEQSYEEEQAKLQNQYEGTDDIKISVPKEPEVNPEVYRDVEPMLFRGFLTLAAEINGVSFIFKSLNHNEFEFSKFSGVLEGSTQKDALWNVFLAYGVFMVDGCNVLTERGRWIPKIMEVFGSLPAPARERIVRYLSEVNRRAANAVSLTEAYAMELTSRYRWAQLKGLDVTSTSVTGIEGTQLLGMNWAQQMWRAINYFEDRNEEHERQWENAKFIGSCMAGKGISKVYNQDNTRRQKERDDRMARKDKILRKIVLGEDLDEKANQLGAAVVVAARSVDELASQLEKDLKGEKDWHDQVIEDHERKIRTKVQDQRTQLEQLAKNYEDEYGSRSVIGGTELSGLSPTEVQHRIDRRKQLEAQSLARHMLRPEVLDPGLGEFVERRYGDNQISEEIETRVSSTDRDTSRAIPITQSNREPGKPFRK